MAEEDIVLEHVRRTWENRRRYRFFSDMPSPLLIIIGTPASFFSGTLTLVLVSAIPDCFHIAKAFHFADGAGVAGFF